MEKQIVALAMGISLIYFIEGLAEIISNKKDAEYKFYYVICPLSSVYNIGVNVLDDKIFEKIGSQSH